MRKKFDKDLKDYDTSLSKLKAAKANKKMTPMKIQEVYNQPVLFSVSHIQPTNFILLDSWSKRFKRIKRFTNNQKSKL